MSCTKFFGRALLPDATTVVNLTTNGSSYEQLVLANAALSIDYLNGSSPSTKDETSSLQVKKKLLITLFSIFTQYSFTPIGFIMCFGILISLSL